MAKRKNKKTAQTRIEIKIEISERIGDGCDLNDHANVLIEIANAMDQLKDAAHAVLKASGEKLILYRAESYWLGELDNILDSSADNGCDGVYGSAEDLREAHDDQNED